MNLEDMLDEDTVEELEDERKRQRRAGTKYGSQINDGE